MWAWVGGSWICILECYTGSGLAIYGGLFVNCSGRLDARTYLRGLSQGSLS